MNVTARDCIFIPCCVYIPAEPPLMGLESLKMCYSQPGKLLAGECAGIYAFLMQRGEEWNSENAA